MNLGEAKTKALQRINEYSNNGNLISESSNKDYLLRMSGFANDAQKEIAEKVGIEATTEYSQTEDKINEGSNKYVLPSDYRVTRFVRLDDKPFFDYRIENGFFVISKRYGGMFEFSYYKDPADITDSTNDDYEFEVDTNAQTIIPYFMGGMVITDENPALSDKLLNIYYAKLGTLSNKPDRSQTTITNTMGW